MARPKNNSKAVRVSVTMSAQMHEVLQGFAEGGLLGKSPAEVIIGMIQRDILRMADEGVPTVERLVGKKK